jgi:hypothetical protein
MAYFGHSYRYAFYQGDLFGDVDGYSIIAARFTAKNTQTISACSVHIGRIESTVSFPKYRIGLQTLGQAGQPSGTWMGATNHAYKDVTISVSDTWLYCQLQEYVPLTSGERYCVIIQALETSSTKRASFSSTYWDADFNTEYGLGGTMHYPSDLTTRGLYMDNAFAKVKFYVPSNSWIESNSGIQPLFIIHGVTSAEGNAALESEYLPVYGTNYISQRINTSGESPYTIATIGIFGYSYGTTPCADLQYEFRNSSDVVIATGTLSAWSSTYSSSGFAGWIELVLGTPVVLSSATWYKFILKSPDSTASIGWQVATTKNTSLSNKLSWDGTSDSYIETSSNSGLTWLQKLNNDMHFRFSLDSSTTTTSSSTSTSSTSSSTISTSTTSSTSLSSSTSSTSSTTRSTSSTSRSTSSTSTSSTTHSTSSTSFTGSTSTSTSLTTTLSFRPTVGSVQSPKSKIGFAGRRRL